MSSSIKANESPTLRQLLSQNLKLLQKAFSQATLIAKPFEMERMISNPEGFVSSGRSSTNLALQLRYAAERGRVHDVRRLLEAGAGIHKDSVRTQLKLWPRQLHFFTNKKWYIVQRMKFTDSPLFLLTEWPNSSPQGCQARPRFSCETTHWKQEI